MTREEMLEEIELLRSEGHNIGIPGHVGEWTCEFDGNRFTGTTPMEAFAAARDFVLPDWHLTKGKP